jgi:2-methylcitrate dehydratase
VQCGFDYRATGVLEAQMSMKYCVARAMIDGVLSLAQFRKEKISEKAAVDLAKRVNFVLDEEIDRVYPREWPSIVEVVMQDGQTFNCRVDSPKGSRENPMTWKAVQNKFKNLTVSMIGDERADRVIHLIEDMQNNNNWTDIIKSIDGSNVD